MDSSHALVTSVEWLSPNIIASGLKDSSIFVHDLRSGGSAMRLQHSHAVAKIRSVDEYRLVVGGINSVSCTIPLFYLRDLTLSVTISSKCTISATPQTTSIETPIQLVNTTSRRNLTSPSPITRPLLSRISTCLLTSVF